MLGVGVWSARFASLALAALAVTAGTTRAQAPSVSLVARIDGPTTLGTGDPLELRIRVHNRGATPVRIIAPVYGSWEHARDPDYAIELLDASGRVVPSALGWEPGLECGVLDRIRPSDVVEVPAHAARALPATSISRAHRILPSARPGDYRLRVRYRSRAPEGTPLELVSNAVPITVTGGDARLWACREAQLRAEESYTAVHSAPIALLPLDDAGSHGVLLFVRTELGRRGASEHHRSQLLALPLDARLAPAGAPVEVFEAAELGYPPAAARTGRGILVAAVHDARASERAQLRALRWDGAGLSLGAVSTLREGGGLGLSLAANGERAWLVQGDMLHGPLRLFPLDADGRPRGAPRELAPARRHSGRGVVSADAGGAWAVWRDLPATGGRVSALRVDPEGRPVGPAIGLAAEGDPVALVDRGRSLALVFSDNGFEGQDPSDGMGLMLTSFSRDGASVGQARGLSPIDRSDPRFGDAATNGATLGHAYVEATHRLVFGIGERSGGRELATTATGVQVDPFGDGFAVAWSDQRDDGSSACRSSLAQCTTETYAARVDARGRVIAGPVRLTSDAVAAPIRASSFDWERFCPAP